MANINLLTPTSIYGRTATFLTGTASTTSNLKSYIASPVTAGKTQLVLGLSLHATIAGEPAKTFYIYKRLPNQTDVKIFCDLVDWAASKTISFTSKEVGGFYLQEGEALIIETTGIPNFPASPVAGYMTYLEID